MRVPARFQSCQYYYISVLSVDLEHALGLLGFLGKGEDIVDVAVCGVDLANQATWIDVHHRDYIDLQG